jgi:hypothetical protein
MRFSTLPGGIASPNARTPDPPVSPVTPEVAGSSPVAPVPTRAPQPPGFRRSWGTTLGRGEQDALAPGQLVERVDDLARSGRLLAHELAHVVQQRGAPSSGPLTVSNPGDALETEADAVADELA